MRPSRVLRCIAIIQATVSAAAVAVHPAQAQSEIPIRLRARMYQYDRSTRTMTASGDVVVIYQDVTILSDRLTADLRTNDVHVEGHVEIRVGQYTVRGAAADFNLTTRRGRIQQAATEYAGSQIQGTLRLKSEVAEGVLGGPTFARQSFCTTCDSPTPVVYLTMRELSVYPNDKIVGRNVTLWIGGRQIFTWPYFIVLLREQRAARLLPVIGRSDIEGWYLKLFYAYALNVNQYGYLRLDLMEKLGIGYGIDHAYRFATGNGNVFLYRLENKQTATTDHRVVLNHQQRFGDLAVRWYSDATVRSLPVDSSDVFASLDLYRLLPGSSTTVYQSYTNRTIAGLAFPAYNASVLYSRFLTPQFTVEVSGSYSQVSGLLGTDEELLPRLALRYQGRGYTATMLVETRADLDGDRFTFDARSTVERLPELTILTDARLLPGTQLISQAQAGVGHFRQPGPRRTVDATRVDATWTLSGPAFASEKGYLGVQALLRGSYYSTGDSRGVAQGQLTYYRFIGTAWRGQVGVTYQDQAGQSPFTFDRTTGRVYQYNTTLTYQRRSLQVIGQASYDMVVHRWAPVTVNAYYTPRENFSAGFALSYDPSLGLLSRAEASGDVRLGTDWRVEYDVIYDGLRRGIFIDNIAVTRFWQDCLAASLSYQGIANEIWLEVWLTALPWARGRVGFSKGNILYDQPWLGLPK